MTDRDPASEYNTASALDEFWRGYYAEKALIVRAIIPLLDHELSCTMFAVSDVCPPARKPEW